MDLLLSNYQPVKFDQLTFSKAFIELIENAQQLDIAVGYVSEKSLDYLADIIQRNGRPFCNLIIGMHYFDKFTFSQFAAAREMEDFLVQNKMGSVKIVTSFPYHGKIYLFKDSNGHVNSIVGSSNLNNILPHDSIRQYELDILIQDNKNNNQLATFFSRLYEVSHNLSSDRIKIDSFRVNNNLMEGLDDVVNIGTTENFQELKNSLVLSKKILIPVTTAPTASRSNINACFGKGRENTRTKIIRKRPWYEVELIVPKEITEISWYPRASSSKNNGVINVFTDDGYKFKCKISGQNDKNFRSDGDLKILGKWLKGRLENAGVLSINEEVTDEILDKYGRKNIDLIPTKDPNLWYLDFSQNGKTL